MPGRGESRHRGREAGRSLHLGAESTSAQLQGRGPSQKGQQRRVDRQTEAQSSKISN